MALSLRHWVLGTVLGCAVVAAAYLPPDHGPDPFPFESPPAGITPERRRLDRLAGLLGQSRSALAVLTFRDSLIRRGRTLPSRGIVLLPAAPPSADRSARVQRVIDTLSQQLGPIDTGIRLVVAEFDPAAVNRTGRFDVQVRSQMFYVLPSATDGRICLALVPASKPMRWQRSLESDSVEVKAMRYALGPCVYYAVFGTPGLAVERWLETHQFDLAGDLDWTLPTPPERGHEGFASIGMVNARFMFSRQFYQGNLFRGSFTRVACAGGHRQACRLAVLDTTREPQLPLPPGLFADNSYNWRFAPRLLEGGYFFSDLIQSQGRDRFARFWRSPLPVDSAFGAAMGVPIDEWTLQWAERKTYHMPLGSKVPLGGLLLSLVLAAVALAGGVALNARRQVG